MSQAETKRPNSDEWVIRQGDTVSVYLSDDDAELNVRRESTTVLSERQEFLARIRISKAASNAYLSKASRETWEQMLNEATSLAVGGHLKTAKDIFSDAEEFLESRAGEQARLWYVCSTVVGIVIFYLLYLSSTLLSLFMEESDPGLVALQYGLLAMISGVIGAGFSLLMRVTKLTVDPAASRNAYFIEAAFRLTIGALAGLTIVIGVQAEVFATFLKVDPSTVEDMAKRATTAGFEADFWKMAILALAAGYSERLVPSLLKQVSKPTGAEAKTPASEPG